MKYRLIVTPDDPKRPVIEGPIFGEDQKDETVRVFHEGVCMDRSIYMTTEQGHIVFFSAERLAHCDVRIVPITED